MATAVDFYIAPEYGRAVRLGLACRLVEKAYKLGHNVYVHADSAAQAEEFDDLLWTFKQNSFVPHGLHSAQENSTNPVLIGWQDQPADHHDVLLNLASEVPPFFTDYARVLEVVDQTAETLAQSRVRFRQYREQDTEPKVNRL